MMEQQVSQHDMNLLHLGNVIEVERVRGRRLKDESAAAKHAVEQTVLVRDIGNPRQRNVMPRFCEYPRAGDEAAVRHRIRGCKPVEPGPHAKDQHEGDSHRENHPAACWTPI